MINKDVSTSSNELPNIGVSLDKLNPFVYNMLKKDCLKGIDNIEKSLEKRTGNILQMFQLDTPKELFFQEPSSSKNGLEQEVLKICHKLCSIYPEYLDNLNRYVAEDNREFEVERFWINYQRPGEFIPLHRHSGMFSFVVWVNLPETKDSNYDVEKWNLGKGYQGQFEFVYSDMLGSIKTLRLANDKSFEGSICVFPAELQHQVYPHYQDEYRITVSGNIRAKI